MKKLTMYLKVEGKLAIRNIDVIFFGVIMPIGIAILIAMVAGGNDTGEGYTYLQATFASLITVGICATAFMGMPLTLADYRDKKILKQFFVTPASPMLLLGVQVIMNALISSLSAIAIYMILHFGWGYQIEGNAGMVIISFFLTMISMFGIGMLLSSICKTLKSANLICTLVYFPMLFLSGATVPFEIFPNWLQTIANVLPLTHGIKLLKSYSLYANPDDTISSMILIIALAVISIAASTKLFKWE